MVDLCVDKRDGSVETSSKVTSNRDLLSKISDLKEIEEVVETEDGVLVRATRDRSGVDVGIDTVVVDGARREGGGTLGGADGDRDGVGDAEIDIETVPDGDRDDSGDAEIDIDTEGVTEDDE